MGIFSNYFNMKVCCVFSLASPHRGDSNEYTQYKVYCVFSSESPHRGDSNEYTQYTIFPVNTHNIPFSIYKRKSSLIIPNLQLWDFPRDLRAGCKQSL